MSLAHSVESAAALAGTVTTSEKIQLFVSYSRDDEQAVVQLIDALERKGDVDVLLDKTDILPSEEWRARLEALIQQADDVVFCVSPDSVTSEVCAWEITVATRLHKRIVPVVLRDTPVHAIPEAIARLNFIFVRTQDPFDEAIDRLHFALGVDIAWIREHTRFGELALQWDRDGRHATDLLRGPALETAESWLSAQPRQAPAPTELQRDFIRASRLGATRRQRNWIVGSLIVAVVSIGLSIVAAWQRNHAVVQRTHANARRLAAEAQVALSVPLASPEAAVQDLLASLQLEKSEQARHALRIGVSRLQPEPAGTLASLAQVPAILRFSPDGARLVVVAMHEVLVWDLKKQALQIRHPVDIGIVPSKLAFTPDGRHAMVLTGTNDQAATKQRILTVDLDKATISEHGFDRIYDAAATGDGVLVLVAGAAPTQMRVVELTSGRTVWEQSFTKPIRVGCLPSGSTPLSSKESASNPMLPMSPMHDRTPSAQGDVVLVDEEGHLSIWRFDQAQPVEAYHLPQGAQPLSFGERGGVIAVRLANGPIAVVAVSQGTELWQGSDTISETIFFTGGDRFVGALDAQGLRIHSLAEGLDVHVEHGRRTDFDVKTMTTLERYSPIIDAQPNEDGSLLFTAWKDGRVDVWRPGLKPRYGGVDAVPRPNFEAVARFDHGDELGMTATWSASPPLFVSPTGRFLASQSMGMKSNEVGGITAVNPLVRIWDTRHGGEIARFRPQGQMLVAFSPMDDFAATLADSGPGEGKSGVADAPQRTQRLELWRLSVPQADVVREQSVFEFKLTKPPKAGDAGHAGKPEALLPPTLPGETVWVGADRKLRMLDMKTRRIVVLDDLGPPADAAFADAKVSGDKLIATMDHTRREEMKNLVFAQDPYVERANQAAMLPPEFPMPLYPVALSGDRQRVLVKLASTLRLYSLDEKRLISTARIGDEILTSSAAAHIVASLTGASELIVSHKGSAVAVVVTTFADAAQGVTRGDPDASSTRHILVLSFASQAPIGMVEQKVFHAPMLGVPPRLSNRPLAISDDGRLLALERLFLEPSGAKSQILVVDPKTGEIRLQPPARDDLFSPSDHLLESPEAAAFSAKEDYLVVEHIKSACPPKIEVLASWLPTYVPSCPEWRTSLRLWDLASGDQVSEVTFDAIRWQPGASQAVSALPPPRSSLALINNEAVIRTNVDFAPRPSDSSHELRVHSERISLDESEVLIQAACRRLPPDLRQISQNQWERTLRGEDYRATCAKENQ